MDKQREQMQPTVAKLFHKHANKVRAADRALFRVATERRMRRHPRMTKKWMRIAKMCMAQHRKEQKVEQAKQRKIAKCFKQRTTRRKDKHNGEKAERGTTQRRQGEETNIKEKEQREKQNFQDEG